MKLNDQMCNAIFNDVDIDIKRNIISVIQELRSAQEKHPGWVDDFVHASAVVAEESGELTRAALQYEYEGGQYYHMHKEAIHTAAMCIRFLINAPEMEIGKEAVQIGNK